MQHRWLAMVLCAASGLIARGEPTTSPVCHDAATSVTGTTKPASPNPAADEAFGRGVDAFNAGDYERAVSEWRASTSAYDQSGDWQRECESSRRLASADQMMGNYRQAMDILCPGREAARGRDERQFMLFSAAMGRALCFTRSHHDPDGDPEVYLREALSKADELNDPATEAAVLNDLGNLYGAQQRLDEARQAFAQSVQTAERNGELETVARARCNAARVAVRAREDGAKAAIDAAEAAIHRLSDGLSKASLLVTLARCMDEAGTTDQAEQTYRSGIELATKLSDDRTCAFGWGYLGGHFEKLGNTGDAISATRRARFISQKLQRDDALYRWEWQLGRLYETRGDLEAAAKAYGRAVDGLSSGTVRDDVALSYAAPIARGQFRQEVGRLYYGLADLLLRQCDNEPDPAKVQQRLRAARSTIERFKTAELKNYFQDDCLKLTEATEQDIDKALATDRTTAIIYLIPLADRTELLLSLPGEANSNEPQLWRAPKVPVGTDELSKLAFDFRDLITLQNDYGYKGSAARFYDLLIRPIDATLKQRGIKTLVFVPDGDLRSVAPAAFYDRTRDRYLVEDYALAITPGLSLSAPRPIGGAARSVRVLAGGLSQQKTVSVAGETVTYRKLEKVADELKEVEAIYGNQRSRMLENQQFVKQNLGKELDEKTYPVVHLATHANFDKDVRKTYVVTADDRPVDLSQLEQIIQPSQFRGQPVELLSLSACETAAGDEGRSALGLAGVAVRAGARSALATLWLADDEATARLIPIFYRQLNASASVTKAQALQRAQIEMLDNDDKLLRHPKLWAQFVIVGNWR
jgi:CHAT domain-containing protein